MASNRPDDEYGRSINFLAWLRTFIELSYEERRGGYYSSYSNQQTLIEESEHNFQIYSLLGRRLEWLELNMTLSDLLLKCFSRRERVRCRSRVRRRVKRARRRMKS